METVRALRIFERSLATRELKYKDMLGNDDSTTYNTSAEIPTNWDVLATFKKELRAGC